MNYFFFFGDKVPSLGIILAGTLALVGFSGGSLRAWALGKLDTLPPDRALVSGLAPLFLILGAQVSARSIFSMAAMPYYALGNLFFAYVILGPSWFGPWNSPERQKLQKTRALPALPLLLGMTVLCGTMAWAIVGLRKYIMERYRMEPDIFSTLLFYFPRTASATDLSGSAFHDYGKLWIPFIYILIFGSLSMFFLLRRKIPRAILLGCLVAAAFLGKIAIAHLSSPGLAVLGHKIESVNNNYYTLSTIIDTKGLYSFIHDFNDIQVSLGNHGDTHPFGPVVFYWILKKILGDHPTGIALAVMFLTSLTVIPLFLLGEKLHGSPLLGYAAAALYLTTPMSLILSGSGIDAVLLLLLALTFYGLTQATDNNDARSAAGAAVLLFFASLLSAGVALFLMFSGLWILVRTLRLSTGPVPWAARALRIILPYVGLLAALHLVLYLAFQGSFSYKQVMDTALFQHRGMNQRRPYDLWIWANVALYVGFAGIPLVAAWLVQTLKKFWTWDASDAFGLLSLPFLFTLVFACMGRAEVQREFLYGIFFLVLPALPLLRGPSKKSSSKKSMPIQPLRSTLFLTLLFYNFVNAVILEMTVLDFW